MNNLVSLIYSQWISKNVSSEKTKSKPCLIQDDCDVRHGGTFPWRHDTWRSYTEEENIYSWFGSATWTDKPQGKPGKI